MLINSTLLRYISNFILHSSHFEIEFSKRTDDVLINKHPLLCYGEENQNRKKLEWNQAGSGQGYAESTSIWCWIRPFTVRYDRRSGRRKKSKSIDLIFHRRLRLRETRSAMKTAQLTDYSVNTEFRKVYSRADRVSLVLLSVLLLSTFLVVRRYFLTVRKPRITFPGKSTYNIEQWM